MALGVASTLKKFKNKIIYSLVVNKVLLVFKKFASGKFCVYSHLELCKYFISWCEDKSLFTKAGLKL